MKSTLIKLNHEEGFDLAALIETRLAILANSGGGKSWAVRRLVDWAFGKVQIIIIDPEGEYGNLRTKYDFILAGQDADAVVETKSAALLATRLLETEASAIVDLYNLVPQDRKHFVRLFVDSIMNAPKELYHDVLIIVDEAHVFAPEKEQSEALGALIALASQGRKRGFCGVFATQRIAKMSKDVLAECNNKMIGRMTLDVDRKRAAEELGITGKEEIRNLRNMQPGEFFVFGPAISNDVIRVQIGDIKVLPPKRGTSRSFKVPPPSAKVKAILAELADLPEAAEKEAKTVKELKEQLATARRLVTTLERAPKPQAPDPDAVKRLTDKAYSLGYSAAEQVLKGEIKELRSRMSKISAIVGIDMPVISIIPPKLELPPQRLEKHSEPYGIPTPDVLGDEVRLGTCERSIYTYLHQHQNDAFSKEQIAVITGYSVTSGGFNNALSKLRTAGLIQGASNAIAVASLNDGLILPDALFSADPMVWGQKLGACERQIYQFLWNRPREQFGKDYIAQQTGYSVTSGGFNNALSRLSTLALIERLPQGIVRLNPAILDL